MYSCIWSMKSFRNIVISARVPRIYSKWVHEVNGMSWIVLRAHMRLSIAQTYFWLTRIVYLNTICFYFDFLFSKVGLVDGNSIGPRDTNINIDRKMATELVSSFGIKFSIQKWIKIFLSKVANRNYMANRKLLKIYAKNFKININI